MWTRLRAIVSRLTFMLARRRLDEDMRLEIDAHLDSLTERYRRQGMSPDEAYIAARRQFGNTALLRQDIREMNGIAWIEHTVQDVRHALRQLARSPAFTGIVIVTLALGIGSTTAIFSVVEAVLLRPLPYPEADRLVRIIERPAEQVNDDRLPAIARRDLDARLAGAASAGPDAVAYRRLFSCHGDGDRRSGQFAASRRDSTVTRGLRDAWCSARRSGASSSPLKKRLRPSRWSSSVIRCGSSTSVARPTSSDAALPWTARPSRSSA